MHTLQPLSLEEVQSKQSYYNLRYQKSSHIRRVSTCIEVSCFLIFIFCVVAIGSSEFVFKALIPTGGLIIIMFLLFISALVTEIFSCQFDVHMDNFLQKQYQFLNSSQCIEMLDLLNSVAEGEVFKKTVLAQGTEFVVKELEMLKHWKANEKQREVYAKLYQVE